MSLVQLLLLSKLLFLVAMTTLKAATVVRANNSIEEKLPNEVLAIAGLCLRNLEKVEIKHLGMSQFLSLSSLLATSQLKIFVPPESQKPQHSVKSILHLLTHYQKTLQELKKLLHIISTSSKTMSTTFPKLNVVVTGNI